MKPKIYNIIADCIDTGIRFGFRKAKKHTDDPTDELISAEIDRAIWEELHNKFVFNIESEEYENEVDY